LKITQNQEKQNKIPSRKEIPNRQQWPTSSEVRLSCLVFLGFSWLKCGWYYFCCCSCRCCRRVVAIFVCHNFARFLQQSGLGISIFDSGWGLHRKQCSITCMYNVVS